MKIKIPIAAHSEATTSQEIKKLLNFCAKMKSLVHFVHWCASKIAILLCAAEYQTQERNDNDWKSAIGSALKEKSFIRYGGKIYNAHGPELFICYRN